MLLRKLLLSCMALGLGLSGFGISKQALALNIVANPGMTPGHVNFRFDQNPTLSESPDSGFFQSPGIAVDGIGTTNLMTFFLTSTDGIAFVDETSGLKGGTGGFEKFHLSWNYLPPDPGTVIPMATVVRIRLNDFDDVDDDLYVYFGGVSGPKIKVTDDNLTAGEIIANLGSNPVSPAGIRLAGATWFTPVSGMFYVERIRLEFQPIPEPGTAALVLVGMAGLAFAGRARRN